MRSSPNAPVNNSAFTQGSIMTTKFALRSLFAAASVWLSTGSITADCDYALRHPFQSDQVATAYTVGADPCVRPESGPLISAGADTQVCPYTEMQTTQNHHPVAAAQNEPQINPLEPGKAIERDLAGGESHSYSI